MWYCKGGRKDVQHFYFIDGNWGTEILQLAQSLYRKSVAEPRAELKISHNRKSGLPLSAAGFVLLVMWAELAPSVLLTVLSSSMFSVWVYFLSETYESNVLQVVNSTDVCAHSLHFNECNENSSITPYWNCGEFCLKLHYTIWPFYL